MGDSEMSTVLLSVMWVNTTIFVEISLVFMLVIFTMLNIVLPMHVFTIFAVNNSANLLDHFSEFDTC
jgi:hypothetical protein